MIKVSNDLVKTLLRTLPLVLGSLDEGKVSINPRLNNAVRLIKIIMKRLTKLYDDERMDKD